MSNRTRNYSFTLNNYTNEEYETLAKIKCKYIIIGKEVGENGTPHIQGFIIFNNAKSFNATKKQLGSRAHIEPSKGTPYSNFVYCSKDGDFVERGDRPEKVGQGNRVDLKEIKDKISQGQNIKKLLDDNMIVNYQQLKYAETLKKYYEGRRTYKPRVEWYYGETGSGKTKQAYKQFEVEDPDKVYVAMDTGRWWDGYDGQEFIIIDDMRADFMKFNQLLKLLDRYAYRVETKGSTRQFLGKHIIITSPYHPADIYPNKHEDIQQLLRRIDSIKQFSIKKDLKKGPIYCMLEKKVPTQTD